MTRFIFILSIIILATIPAIAQFDVGSIASSKSSIHAPAAPTVTPTGFTPSSATASDTAAGGSLIQGLTVTLSNGGTFNGTCGYGTPQSNTDPTGLTTLSSTSGGCNLNVNSSGYTSANDGTYQLTINPCQSGICLNPSSPNFTLTISGSACASGVPAAACAGCLASNGGSTSNGSCFNTLALNLDFTTSSAVSGYSNGTKFNAQTVSNWLNCGGGTSTYNVMGVSAGNGSTGSPTPPCSDFPIITDAGGSVLQMIITPSDVSAGAGSWTMFSEHAIPANFYAEIRMKTPNTNYNPSASLRGDFWSYTAGTAPPCLENDFIETFAGGPSAGANACNPTLEQHNWAANGITYDPTNYHTYGERITGDGNGSVSYCFYVDEVQVNAETYLPTTGNCGPRGPDPQWVQNYQTALSLLVQVGQEDTNAITDNILQNIQSIKLWACSNWVNATPGTGSGNGTGGQCTGTVLNSNP